jgi:hypothetical protein
MNNQPTDIELLTGIPLRTKSHDLGTEIVAEMYSNSNKKRNKNKNKNTFQQSTGPSDPTNENGWGQAPSSFPPSLSEKKDQEIPGDRKYGRRIKWQTDKIVSMHLQLSHIKVGDRYSRCKAYISIKTEDDPRYMIFMRSDLTTANYETLKSIKKDGDKVLQTTFDDEFNKHNGNIFTGRVKYKRVKGQKIEKHHRVNLPLALLIVYHEDEKFKARFHLLGQDYDFDLDDELSTSQKKFYSYQGFWEDNVGMLTMEEAFGG